MLNIPPPLKIPEHPVNIARESNEERETVLLSNKLCVLLGYDTTKPAERIFYINNSDIRTNPDQFHAHVFKANPTPFGYEVTVLDREKHLLTPENEQQPNVIITITYATSLKTFNVTLNNDPADFGDLHLMTPNQVVRFVINDLTRSYDLVRNGQAILLDDKQQTKRRQIKGFKDLNVIKQEQLSQALDYLDKGPDQLNT